MNDDELTHDRALAELAEYAKRIAAQETDGQRDTIMLGCAAAAIYEEKSWVSDMDERQPLVKKKSLGRPVDPESRERFGKWLAMKTAEQGGVPLATVHTRRLMDAAALAKTYLSQGQKSPSTERQVRPLKPLVKEGRADDIPKVWQSAVDKAGADGLDEPTARHVATARAEYRASLPKPVAGHAKSVPSDQRKSRALAELYWLMGNGHFDVVDDIIAKIQAYPRRQR